MASLSNTKIKDTYQSLVKFSDNGNITISAKRLTDGFGNNSPLYVSTTQIGIGITPQSGYGLHVSNNVKIGGNLEVSGNLTVNGTLTYLNVTDLEVDDPLIQLAVNNASNILDIGLFGKYVSSGTKYKGFFNDASDDKFKLFTGLTTKPLTTVDTSDSGYTVGTLVANLEGNADTATGVLITADSADTSRRMVFTESNNATDTDGRLFKDSANNFFYNPSSNTLTLVNLTGTTGTFSSTISATDCILSDDLFLTGTNSYIIINGSTSSGLQFYSPSDAKVNMDARDSGTGAVLHKWNRNSDDDAYVAYYEKWYDGNSYHAIGIDTNLFRFNSGIVVTGTVEATEFSGPLTGNVTGDLTGSVIGGTISGTTGTFSNNISALGGSFTNPVTIYDTSVSENPRLSLGRQAAESLQFDVTDRVAIIRHKNDADSNQVHSLDFIIDTPSTAEKIFSFKEAGNTTSTYLTIDSTGATFTNYVTAERLRVGDGTDGYFYSDIAGRTAFAGGNFYIQSNVSNYYNYAANSYHGSTSGDNQKFRGNPLTGDNWDITPAGVVTATSFVGNAYLNTIAYQGGEGTELDNSAFNVDGIGTTFRWIESNSGATGTTWKKVADVVLNDTGFKNGVQMEVKVLQPNTYWGDTASLNTIYYSIAFRGDESDTGPFYDDALVYGQDADLIRVYKTSAHNYELQARSNDDNRDLVVECNITSKRSSKVTFTTTYTDGTTTGGTAYTASGNGLNKTKFAGNVEFEGAIFDDAEVDDLRVNEYLYFGSGATAGYGPHIIHTDSGGTGEGMRITVESDLQVWGVTGNAGEQNQGLYVAGGVAKLYDLNGVVLETVLGGVKLPDNTELKIGTGSDLKLYHNETHSFITNTTGDLTIENTGDDLILKSADDFLTYVQGTEVAIQAIGNAGVKLRYNNVNKFETTSTGAKISGYIDAGTDGGTSGSRVLAQTYNTTGDYIATLSTMYSSGGWLMGYGIEAKNSSSGFISTADNADFKRTYVLLDNNEFTIGYAPAQTTTVGDDITGLTTPFTINLTNGNATLSGTLTADLTGDVTGDLTGDVTGAASLNVLKAGDTMTGNLKLNDNVYLQIGNRTDGDAWIYHNGTDTLFRNAVGDLYIDQLANDKKISFRCDDGSGGIVEYFRIDGNDSRVIYGRSIQMADNVSVYFGNTVADDGYI